MALNKLLEMEMSALSVLKRAGELDQSNRFQESLLCYKEGIKLLLDAVKAMNDHINIDQAEQIKAPMDKLKEEGKYHEQIKIAADATGYGYGNLFKPYISSELTEVWVEDPYIQHDHQLSNFVQFCVMLLNAPCKVKRIQLLTLQDESHGSQQESALTELKQSLEADKVTLELQYSSTIQDREIRFDNGWIIKIGRGLDYFKEPIGTYSIGFFDYDLRQCHETTVDIFYAKHKKNQEMHES